MQDVRLSAQQLIQPLFVIEGLAEAEDIQGLTGNYRETERSLLERMQSDLDAGISSFLLFGVPAGKKTHAFDGAFTARCIQAIKKRFGSRVFLAVDVCLCSLTTHGHCGILEGDHILNNASVVELANLARIYAEAGADCIAPSDMMDGRIGAIRDILDSCGLDRVLIMSYAAKFHSKFYGPFRLAADSSPRGIGPKDRATYQIDPANMKDALVSACRDEEEGADIIMIKPALPYLDIVRRIADSSLRPLAVYQVSGEYAAIELMGQHGLMDAVGAHREAWTACIRAGSSMIITYGARNWQKILGYV